MTHLARHVDVRQELHLYLGETVALASLATPALDIEAEAPGLVAACSGLRHARIDLADRTEEAGVGRRVAARRPADGCLVDDDDAIDMFDARQSLITARLILGPVQRTRESLVQAVVDERRLPRARDTRDAREHMQGNICVDMLEVVLRGARKHQMLPVGRAPRHRQRHGQLARQVLSRQRRRFGDDVLDAALCHDVPTVLASAGSHVDDVVRTADRLLVMFHDDQRVAQITQFAQRSQEALVIPWVQADGRFVQDVQDADQLAADLRGQTQALRLSTRQRCGGARERQITQPDIQNELEPLIDLAQDLFTDRALRLGHPARQSGKERCSLIHRHVRHLTDVETGKLDSQRLRLQPPSVAARTFPLQHEPFILLLHGLGGRLLVPARQKVDEPFPMILEDVIGALGVFPVDGDAFPVAVQDDVHRSRRQVAYFLLPIVAPIPKRLDDKILAERGSGKKPGDLNGSFHQRPVAVDDHVHIRFKLKTEARAGRAGAIRRVEREQPRLDFLDTVAADRAGECAGEKVQLASSKVQKFENVISFLQRQLDGIEEPRALPRIDDDPVDDELDRMFAVLVHRRNGVVHAVLGTVDAVALEPLAVDVLDELAILALASLDDRREEGDAAATVFSQDMLHDLLWRLLRNGDVVHGAAGNACARKQQTQVIVDLGQCPDGGARVLACRLLVDRDGGRQPFDEVDVWFLHEPDELAGICRQRLDVAALPLGVECVKRERGLARTGDACNHDKLVAWQAYADVFQVVNAGALDENAVLGHADSSLSDRRSWVLRQLTPKNPRSGRVCASACEKRRGRPRSPPRPCRPP